MHNWTESIINYQNYIKLHSHVQPAYNRHVGGLGLSVHRADFKLDWLRCFAALSTYKDSAAAAAAAAAVGWSSRGSCTWIF